MVIPPCSLNEEKKSILIRFILKLDTNTENIFYLLAMKLGIWGCINWELTTDYLILRYIWIYLTDSCAGIKCNHGEVCFIDGSRPRCKCPPRCIDRRIQRVCGTDGITYRSYCELMRTACVIGDKTLTKKQDGRCGSTPPTKPPATDPPTPSPTGNFPV